MLVTAHVLGHADFSTNNMLFRRSQDQVGEHIVEQAAAHARQIGMAIEEHGLQRVEAVLDTALALEQHIDIDQGLRRPRYPELVASQPAAPPNDEFSRRFADTGPDTSVRKRLGPRSAHPSRASRARPAVVHRSVRAELEPWERDIFLAVREESSTLSLLRCQIMNEGWASYCMPVLLREADFLPQSAYVDAIKCHSDVVRRASGESGRSRPIRILGFLDLGKDRRSSRGSTPRARSCARRRLRFVRKIIRAMARAELKRSASRPGDRHVDGAEMDCPVLHEALLAPKRVRCADRERHARARRWKAGAGARVTRSTAAGWIGARTQGAGYVDARVATTVTIATGITTTELSRSRYTATENESVWVGL